MNIKDFIERLKAQCPTLQNRVFGSVELASSANSMQTPCVFVVPMAERAEPNMLMNGFSQRITAQIGIVICVKNVKDARGENGHIELEKVQHEIRTALCGWQAPNTIVLTKFVQSQLAAYDNLILRWNEVFSTTYFFEV